MKHFTNAIAHYFAMRRIPRDCYAVCVTGIGTVAEFQDLASAEALRDRLPISQRIHSVIRDEDGRALEI